MSKVQVKLRIDFGAENAIGPGKIALLERMRDTGSLSQAARELKMSYRRAWQLLESLNTSFREPAVLTSIGGKGGGGTELTNLGKALIAAYREIEADVSVKAKSRFEWLVKKAAPDAGKARASRKPLTRTQRGRVASRGRKARVASH
jgi:molybdate transport system regulatory protein